MSSGAQNDAYDLEDASAFPPGCNAAEPVVIPENFDFPFPDFGGSRNPVYNGPERALTLESWFGCGWWWQLQEQIRPKQ